MPRKPKPQHPQPEKNDRCQHATSDGRRCRAPRMNDDASLCFHHWERQQHLLSAESVGAELLGSLDDFKTATAVNHALGKLFALLARNRIPVRNAAILAYIGQLLLNSLSSVKREITLDQGFSGWQQAVRCALRNELRRSAASRPPKTLRHAATPPDQEQSGAAG